MKRTILKISSTSVAVTILCAVLSGCVPGKGPITVEPILSPQIFTVQTLGYSAEHRPIELYSAGEGFEIVLIFSAIHGNEQAGIPLVHKLMEHLRHRGTLLAERKVLIIPVANPDGVVRNTRGNANGIDLNRNFPAANRQNSSVYGHVALTEPESNVLFDLINSCKPHRIVSIHQPLKCIDYDGPAEELAWSMAAYCSLPVTKLGARPGSFGSYAGETLGIPIITMELERADDNLTPEQLWLRYGISLLAAISHPKTPY